MNVTKGQKLAGELLEFFGLLAIIAVGLFYCCATLMWLIADQSADGFRLVAYYVIALLIGAVGQSLGGVMVYAGGYMKGKRRGENERHLLLGSGLMITRDVIFVVASLFIVSLCFALIGEKLFASGMLAGLSVGNFYLGYLIKKQLKIMGLC